MGLYNFDLSKKRDVILASDLEAYFGTIDENLQKYGDDTQRKIDSIQSTFDPWSIKAESLSDFVKAIMNRDLASSYIDDTQKEAIKSVKASMEALHGYLVRDLEMVQSFSAEDRQKVEERAAELDSYISAIKDTEKKYNPNIVKKSASYAGQLLKLTVNSFKTHFKDLREFMVNRGTEYGRLLAYNTFGKAVNKVWNNHLNEKLKINLEHITKNNQKIEKNISNKARHHEISINLKGIDLKDMSNTFYKTYIEKNKLLLEKCEKQLNKAEKNNKEFLENVDDLKKNILKQLDSTVAFDLKTSLAFMNHYSNIDAKKENKCRNAELERALEDFKKNKELDVSGARDTFKRMTDATFEVDGERFPLLDSDQLHVIREAMKDGRDVSEIMQVVQRAQSRTNLDIPSAENLKIYFACQEYGFTLDKYPTFEALAKAEPRTFESIKDARENNPVLDNFNRVYEANKELPLTEMKLPEQFADTIEEVIKAEKSCENIAQIKIVAEQHINDCQQYTNELEAAQQRIQELEAQLFELTQPDLDGGR